MGKYNGSAIDWFVVTVDKTNRRMLLVTKYILEKGVKFSNSKSGNYWTWTGSTLRTTLNGSFMNGFTDKRRARFLKCRLWMITPMIAKPVIPELI